MKMQMTDVRKEKPQPMEGMPITMCAISSSSSMESPTANVQPMATPKDGALPLRTMTATGCGDSVEKVHTLSLSNLYYEKINNLTIFFN